LRFYAFGAGEGGHGGWAVALDAEKGGLLAGGEVVGMSLLAEAALELAE
jgi:hypothetical protein